jgi:hypothetical protein
MTVRAGLSIEYGIGEREMVAPCLLIHLSALVSTDARASLLRSGGSLPDLHHAARMLKKLRQALLLLQSLGSSLRHAVTVRPSGRIYSGNRSALRHDSARGDEVGSSRCETTGET